MKITKVKPFDIYIDPEVTHLEPRWWHKLMFWQKFVYPKWKIKSVKVSLKDVRKGNY